MTSIFEGHPLKTRLFPTQTRAIWVPGICTKQYVNKEECHSCMIPTIAAAKITYPFFLGRAKKHEAKILLNQPVSFFGVDDPTKEPQPNILFVEFWS